MQSFVALWLYKTLLTCSNNIFCIFADVSLLTGLRVICCDGGQGQGLAAPWDLGGNPCFLHAEAESFLSPLFLLLTPATVSQLPQHVPVMVVIDFQWLTQACKFTWLHRTKHAVCRTADLAARGQVSQGNSNTTQAYRKDLSWNESVSFSDQFRTREGASRCHK